MHGRVLKPAGPWAKLTSLDEAGARAVAGRHRRGARRQLRRRHRRDRGGGGGGPRRPAQGRGVERGRRRCPTKASSPTGSRASRSRPPPSTSARPPRRRKWPAPSAGSLRVRSSPTPRWRPRARSRNGPVRTRCTSGRTARASTICAPTWRWRWGCRPENIVVQHVEGAGCYGHNGADDVAFDAVLLARAAGGPPSAGAVVARGRAGLGADGRSHGRRDRGRSRCRRRHRRLARRGLEQRPRIATRAHAPSRPCSRPRSSPSRSSASLPSIRRWRTAAARSATPCRSTTSPPCASPATGC